MRLKAFTLFCLIACAVPKAHAGKLDAYFGAYDFSAATAVSKGSKSGLGAYKIGIMFGVTERFEAGLGYSLIYSDVFGGDSVYGLDVEGHYYFLTPSRREVVEGGPVTLTTESAWRPFIAFGFNARQFQSIATQYNGLSLGVGTERVYDKRLSFKGLLRYTHLEGPPGASALEISVLGGVCVNF